MSVREPRWRARGRLFCWLLLANMLGRGACVVANPFAPEFSPALGELAWDGGLRWQMPLTALQLEPGVEIDITLDHELVALDYGEVESRIAVRPLETGVCRNNGRVIWTRPGGGILRFGDRDRGTTPPARPETVGNALVEIYQQGRVRLFWSEAERRAWVEDSGWVLHYERGSLVRFSSPSGRIFEVTSHGRRVASICVGDKRLLAVDTGERGMLECMTARGVVRFRLTAPDSGRIEAVGKEGGRALVTFTYGTEGLLSGIGRGPTSAVDLGWAPNMGAERGDSTYRLPIHLALAGKHGYRFRISGGVIDLEQSEPGTATRRLRIGVQYGMIRWVKESD